MNDDFEYDGLRAVLTCHACPEQYAVYKGDEEIGYIRLRHGHLYATEGDAGGSKIYEAETRGDGMFYDEKEREYHLKRILKLLHRAYNERKAV